ncbi:universal stress protein [Oricola cellulosilytica]|uniref:Universal stress protein n=1 Tax=Oricola cellulosilytica TaxID=1429082 RepID=A0A4R0P802_9HYPH|nr:universal stress protein [Oricola cellulosilytica]TCD13170.1 universal stress protein [Oricola cellulosilytica]
MYKKIIVALSLEHGISERALEAASVLADDGAEILAVHIYEPLQGSVRFHLSEDDLRTARNKTESILKERVKNHPGVTPVLLEGHAGQTLAEYAEDVGADCIVIGSHKPGLRDFLLGSTAARIVRHAHCSVHVLR